MEKLTLKTLALVAVSSSDRGQTLEAIDVECATFSDEGILFPIYSLLKTTRKGKPLKVVRCLKSSDERLDVCSYVSNYLTCSLKFRLKAVERGGVKP